MMVTMKYPKVLRICSPWVKNPRMLSGDNYVVGNVTHLKFNEGPTRAEHRYTRVYGMYTQVQAVIVQKDRQIHGFSKNRKEFRTFLEAGFAVLAGFRGALVEAVF